jgi:hypothetical protein
VHVPDLEVPSLVPKAAEGVTGIVEDVGEAVGKALGQ